MPVELVALGHVAAKLKPCVSCSRADHPCGDDGWATDREPLGGVYSGHRGDELDPTSQRRMGWRRADEHFWGRSHAILADRDGASWEYGVREVCVDVGDGGVVLSDSFGNLGFGFIYDYICCCR